MKRVIILVSRIHVYVVDYLNFRSISVVFAVALNVSFFKTREEQFEKGKNGASSQWRGVYRSCIDR